MRSGDVCRYALLLSHHSSLNLLNIHMLAIKLSRYGKKKQPMFRVIILEKTKDPWGKYLENLGTMNPRAEKRDIKLNVERIKYWLAHGAQPTETVRNLLIDEGIMKGEKSRTIRMSRERTAKLAAAKGEGNKEPAKV